MFFDKKCPYCRGLKPELEKLSEKVYNEFNIGMCDCKDEKSKILCQDFKVPHYPYIVYLKNNKMYIYEGRDRTAIALERFIRSDYKDEELNEQLSLPQRPSKFTLLLNSIDRSIPLIVESMVDILDTVLFKPLGMHKSLDF